MPRSIDDETREIIVSFVSEGYERLDDSEAQLSKLEEEGDNTARLNSVFRLFHSVKGSAGYLGFEAIKKLTHEAETLLDVFLKEKIQPTPKSIDIVFETIDELRKLIAIVEKEFSDESGAESALKQSAKISAEIASLRASIVKPEITESKITEVTKTVESGQINEIFLSPLVSADMVQRFIGECADLIDRTEKNALALNPKENNHELVHDMFRAIHTIKGNSGFFGHAYLERICKSLEAELDTARQNEGPCGEAFGNSVIRYIDLARNALKTVVIHDQNSSPEKDGEDHPQQAEYKPIGEILIDMGAVGPDALDEALRERDRPLGEVLVDKGIIDSSQVESALKIQKAQMPANSRESSNEIVRKEIRVDTAKLDKLFELVGELITAESMVYNSPDLKGVHRSDFNKSFTSLNKISREIQETTMMIRMIPLDGLFQKMTRLVRDLSRKFDRPINLTVSGQDTEMDKNVIEQISDPLVHILRNAIDHGIEPREKRKAAGKPETGTVSMSAKYEGSEIWITVTDDGAGLDREKICRKAVERGLIKTDPALLADKDIWAFIFEPGFSTAEIVSDVSGRGVGLDVVKKNLEKIHGRIDIKTSPGSGTDFILAIPLTMAIIDGITVRAGKNRYSLPLNDIIEFVKVVPQQITRTEKNAETVNIRSEFLPLLKMYELFDIPETITDPSEGIIIIVQNNGRKACILIDEVIGNQQIVVKSLSEYLGKVEGISGCSILGDGGVSFIIDTGRLLSLRLE